MTKTFRLRKSTFYSGASFSALFLILAILSGSILGFSISEKNMSENEPSLAFVAGLGGATCSVMFLLSMYSVIAYRAERIILDDDGVRIRSVFQDRLFHVADITQLKWRVIPAGGSLVIRRLDSKGKIDFYGYSDDDILQIIRLLRKLVSADKQVGWAEFCHKIALSIRDGRPPVLREDPSFRTVKITRSRYDRFFLAMTIISAGHAVIWGFLLSSWEILALLPIVVLFWLVLRFTIPITGKFDTEPRPSNKMRAGMVCFAVLCLSPFALLPVLWHVDGRIVLGIFGLLSYGGMLGMIFFWGQRKVWSKKAIEEIHQRALIEWDEGERLINSTPPAPC